MGRYDKFYENYYKKLNSDDEKIENTSSSYDESYFVNNKYGRKQNNSKGTIAILVTIPILVLGGLGTYKFSKTEQGQKLYNTFLNAMNSMEIVSSDKEINSDDTRDKQEDATSNMVDKDAVATSTNPESFVLGENNVEKVSSDKKYSEVVSALSGVEVKAKSEQGVVLLCKYKIIATSLSGIVEDIGENAEGHFLTIDHGNNIKTSYYNLPEVNYVKGEAIKKGEVITEIKEEREIVFKIKEEDEFITPNMYLDFI